MHFIMFIVLAIVAIVLCVNLTQALFEELTQDIYTVTHEHATYFTRMHGTNKCWLQDLRTLALVQVVAAIVLWFVPFKEVHGGVVLATVYLLILTFSFCLFATGYWWRGYAVKVLRGNPAAL